MKRKALSVGLCVFLLFFASGCWDSRDINNTAFALALGIDRPMNPSTATYKATIEFADPDPGKPTPSSLVVSAEGDSIIMAIQRIQTSVSRKISFSHLRVLVVGEEIAKERDFRDLSSYFMKHPEVALRLRLLFLQGDEAETLRNVEPQYDSLLASQLVSMGQLQQEVSLVRTNNFYRLWSDLKANNGTAFGSRISLIDGATAIAREGGAVFRDWKLIGWLNAKEAQESNWLVRKTQAVVVAKEGGNSYSYQTANQSTKIIPQGENGDLGFIVRVTTSGIILEETGEGLDFSKAESLRKVESIVSEAIEQQIRSAIDKAQRDLQTDYLGFGEALEQHQPDTVKSADWQKIFPLVPIHVEVEARVTSSGLQS